MPSEISQSHKGRILYGSTYVRDLEQSDSRAQKVEGRLAWARGKEEWGVIV